MALHRQSHVEIVCLDYLPLVTTPTTVFATMRDVSVRQVEQILRLSSPVVYMCSRNAPVGRLNITLSRASVIDGRQHLVVSEALLSRPMVFAPVPPPAVVITVYLERCCRTIRCPSGREVSLHMKIQTEIYAPGIASIMR